MPNESGRQQLMRIMDIDDREEEYFLRIDPTPPVRDYFSRGDSPVVIDSISMIDLKTGEEILKPPTQSELDAWK